MGYVPQPTPEMGEYSVEVRRESFYLSGAANFRWIRSTKPGVDVERYYTADYRFREGEDDIEIAETDERPDGDGWVCRYVERRHGIWAYKIAQTGQLTVEILIEDIDKIRAALDLVERLRNSDESPAEHDNASATPPADGIADILNGPVILTKSVDLDAVTFHRTAGRDGVYVNIRYAEVRQRRHGATGYGFSLADDDLRALLPATPPADARAELLALAAEIACGVDLNNDCEGWAARLRALADRPPR